MFIQISILLHKELQSLHFLSKIITNDILNNCSSIEDKFQKEKKTVNLGNFQ